MGSIYARAKVMSLISCSFVVSLRSALVCAVLAVTVGK